MLKGLTDEYMAKKNRKRLTTKERRLRVSRRVRWWVFGPTWFVLLTAMGMGIGFGAYQVACFVKTSPAFSVRRVEVRGIRRTRKEDILLAAGIVEGMNVFSLDAAQVRKQLLELPWIREVESARVVPDTLIIEVKEHEPVAMINLGSLYYLSASGEVFKRVQPADVLDLPVLTGFSRSAYNHDSQRAEQRVSECLRIFDRVRSVPCLKQHRVAEIHLDELMGPTVVLDPGALSVRLSGKDIDSRLHTLCRLLDRLADQSLRPHTILLDHDQRPNWATVRLDEQQVAINE